MTCCFCGEEMKMENGAEHSCETTYSPADLTDEEIIACIDESEPDTTDMIRFAKAILRKAQE